MWSKLVYMAPVLSILSKIEITEDVKMEGRVDEEIRRVFEPYLKTTRLVLVRKPIHARVIADYPKGTSLWTILDGIMALFHLDACIDTTAWGDILLTLEEGLSWKR